MSGEGMNGLHSPVTPKLFTFPTALIQSRSIHFMGASLCYQSCIISRALSCQSFQRNPVQAGGDSLLNCRNTLQMLTPPAPQLSLLSQLQALQLIICLVTQLQSGEVVRSVWQLLHWWSADLRRISATSWTVNTQNRKVRSLGCVVLLTLLYMHCSVKKVIQFVFRLKV